MLEHNVRLQVEVEELRRQLSDKQELLAAAAEAIDVLENQVGCCFTDAVQLFSFELIIFLKFITIFILNPLIHPKDNNIY